jgi:hypothetical protein
VPRHGEGSAGCDASGHGAAVPVCWESDADRPVPDTNPHLHDRQLLTGPSGSQRQVPLSGVVKRSAGHDC